MHGSSRPKVKFFVPPPLIFGVPLGLGLLLHRRHPLVRAAAPVTVGLRWLGGALVAAGAGHALSSVALFVRSRTTVLPHRRSSALVTRGAYRWTRNPMYLGMTLVYAGVSALAAAVWPLLLLPFSLFVMDRRVIPAEERQLEEVFGPAYRAYLQRVRRWI